MASISGTNLAAGVVPFTTEDTFPTHYSKYGAGGWHEVSTEADKDLIPEARRVVGMAVSVVETAKTYTLQEDGTWKEISADVDLSDYYTKTEVDTALNDKQNTLTAGTGISIVDNTISSTVTADVTSVNGKKGDVIVDSISDQHTSDMIKIWTGTKAEYDALTSKDPNTLYCVKKEGTPIDIYELLDGKQDKLVAGTSISLTSNEDGTVTIANVDPNVQSDWNADTGSAVILNKPTLATVATSGSYNDLTDKPTIPEAYTLPVASSTVMGGIKVGSGLSVTDDGTLSAEGGSGVDDYTALTNKPQINSVELTGNKTLVDLGIQASGDYATKSELPTKTSDLTNDSGFLTSAPVESVNGETGTVVVKSLQNANTDNVMYKLWVGTQDEYDAIETKDTNTIYYVQKEGTPIDIEAELAAKQDKLTAGTGVSLVVDEGAGTTTLNNTAPNVQSDWNSTSGDSQILNKPTLSTVATSGSYNDLTDKPTIPEAYILPTASNTVLGGVKIGNGLTISGDGVVSVDSSSATPINDLTDFATGIQQDKVYKATITSAVTPTLPTVTDSNTHSIIIYASIGTGGSITDFGTTRFYNSEKPVPAEGDVYDLVYVYNPVITSWVCNAIKINTL